MFLAIFPFLGFAPFFFLCASWSFNIQIFIILLLLIVFVRKKRSQNEPGHLIGGQATKYKS